MFLTLKPSEQKIIELNKKITLNLTKLVGLITNVKNSKIKFTTKRLMELDYSFEQIFNPISTSFNELTRVQVYKSYPNYETLIDQRIDTLNQQYEQLSHLAQ